MFRSVRAFSEWQGAPHRPLEEALSILVDGLHLEAASLILRKGDRQSSFQFPADTIAPSVPVRLMDTLGEGAEWQPLLVADQSSLLGIGRKEGSADDGTETGLLLLGTRANGLSEAELLFLETVFQGFLHHSGPSSDREAGRLDPAREALHCNITELVEARQLAEANEALFRELLVSAPVPMTLTLQDEIVYANALAHKLLGVPDGELIGRQSLDFYWNREDRKKLLSVLLKDSECDMPGLEIRTADGRKKTTHLICRKTMYQGQIANFASFMDISDFIRTKRALEQSEKQNRDLVSLIPDALVVQVKGRIVFLNESAVRMFGWEAEADLIGRDSLALAYPEDRDRVLQLRLSALAGKNAQLGNTRHVDRYGKMFDTEMFVRPVEWDGEAGTMSIIRDVSDRHSFEAELMRREREMSLAQEIGNFGHWRAHIDQGEVYWSEKLYRIHGREPEEGPLTLDQGLAIVAEKDRAMMKETVVRALETGEEQDFEIEVMTRRPDGNPIVMAGSIRPERDELGRAVAVFGVSQDVTDRRQLEEKLRQSQKMEAVGQLTGGVAHDFNNLLAVIRGNAELLEGAGTAGEAEQARLAAILRATDRGERLTRSMLAFSRKQQLQPVVTRLDRQVQDLIGMLGRLLGEQVEIRSRFDSGLWSCVADPGQVENALLNLVLNARDAMPGGGILTISAENSSLSPREASEFTDVKAGKYVRLSVRDTGAGISEDILEHVFEPFFTTKETGRGTGLGLSMVYGFAKQSGGHVTIRSVPAEGTVVSIYLPETGSELLPESRPRDVVSDLDGIRVLLVEDDEDLRELTAHLLKKSGATVFEANAGAAALHLVQEKGLVPDVLLSDVILPGGMNGPAIADELCRGQPGLKVVFMSGYTEDAFADALKGGADSPLLNKPFHHAQLVERIRSVLQG
ncbi:hybrid sensor histidine kinase/response regulator [Sneathiella chinensis]|uniref:hybrid sensor histidine kinase/response regulator n=1 Tax=Sneathiella chinensis TaxID=349750 RepID=UPI00146F49DB|nr:PAS domain-containing sensor histidine kinase [Sneathiella chinensis]